MKYENRIKIILQYLSQSVVRIKSSSKWQGCISELRINKILKRPNINQLRKGKDKKWNFISTAYRCYSPQSKKERQAGSQPMVQDVGNQKSEVLSSCSVAQHSSRTLLGSDSKWSITCPVNTASRADLFLLPFRKVCVTC